MFSELVIDHFKHPRNVGRLDAANATGRAQNPGCGDEVEVSLRVLGDFITDVRFCARGCVAAIACGSRLTQLVRGRPVSEALSIGRAELLDAMGGLPPTSVHAAQLTIDALRAALEGDALTRS